MRGRRLLVVLLAVCSAYAIFELGLLYGDRQKQEPPHTSPTQVQLLSHQEHRPEPSTQTDQKRPLSNRATARGNSSHQWRLYGESSFDNDNGDARLGLSRRESSRLFSNTSRDERVQDLLVQLEVLQVSCYERPESDQKSLDEKYGEFLEMLANYTLFHARERERASAKRLVWICDIQGLCGGLGDRIRGVAYTLLLAMMSERVLLFDWRDSSLSHKTYLEPNAIDWRLTEKEKERVFQKKNYIKADQSPGEGSVTFIHISSAAGYGGLEADISEGKLKSNLGAVVGDRGLVGMETNMYPSSLVYSKTTASLEWLKRGVASLGLDKLSQLDIDGLIGVMFRYFFRFSQEVVGEVDEARRVLGLNDLTYVGLHVRTGFVGSKYVKDSTHPKFYPQPWKWEKLLECVHNYTTENFAPGALIFLATDSHLVKDMALQKYGGQMRSLNNTLIHMDRLKLSPDKAGDFEREGVLSMWVEIVLLAEAHSLVMGESGLPFLAKSLCLIPRARTLSGLTCTPLQFLEKTYRH